ncbi:MAG: B12-binding domain-containing radical SAM protein [Candidatus Sungbacteria bacterium]|nr:B12-binding domain-containing radical SAM protein [Candidatus Sungbacteria bacterium]
MKRNALLVYPEFGPSFWSFKFALQYLGKKSSMPSLGLLTIAGMFPDDYNLRLVDMNVQTLTDADLTWADIVFTSTMIVQRKSLECVVARAKRAGKPVVAGGPHPTSYWEEIEDVDYFLLGEVEATFSGFLQDLKHGTARHIYLPQEKPAITRTPLPRFDLINMRAYGSMLLQFSRGCPFDCEFCDITKLYGRIPRTKTPKQMLAEFDLLYNLGWRGALFLVDDNFIGNRRDALLFLNELIPWQAERNYPFDLYTEASMNLVEYPKLMEGMVEAGFTSVFVGIETPTPAALLMTKKGQNVDRTDPEYPLHAVQTLQSKGLEVTAGFILGLDNDTSDAFDLHIKFIEKAAIALAMEGLLTVLKGTDLYYRMEREGRLLCDTTGNSVAVHLNFEPQIPEEVLINGYKRVLNTIYDRDLENYFARCFDLLQRVNRHNAPKPMHTPIRMQQAFYFTLATIRQLASSQRSAYLRFLAKVLINHPGQWRQAFAMAAKGYHLRRITEQITVIHNLKQYLASSMVYLQTAATRRIPEKPIDMEAYARMVITSVKNDYKKIHPDFLYDATRLIGEFYTALGQILPESDLPRFI